MSMYTLRKLVETPFARSDVVARVAFDAHAGQLLERLHGIGDRAGLVGIADRPGPGFERGVAAAFGRRDLEELKSRLVRSPQRARRAAGRKVPVPCRRIAPQGKAC